MTMIQSQSQASLFERLGGTPGITSIVDDIVAAHMENPAIKSRFLPYREDQQRLGTAKKHLCDFLAAGTGGAANYTGRSMPDTHRGMNISEREYMAALDDILSTLHKHGIDEQSQREILAIAYSLKGEIMHL